MALVGCAGLAIVGTLAAAAIGLGFFGRSSRPVAPEYHRARLSVTVMRLRRACPDGDLTELLGGSAAAHPEVACEVTAETEEAVGTPCDEGTLPCTSPVSAVDAGDAQHCERAGVDPAMCSSWRSGDMHLVACDTGDGVRIVHAASPGRPELGAVSWRVFQGAAIAEGRITTRVMLSGDGTLRLEDPPEGASIRVGGEEHVLAPGDGTAEVPFDAFLLFPQLPESDRVVTRDRDLNRAPSPTCERSVELPFSLVLRDGLVTAAEVRSCPPIARWAAAATLARAAHGGTTRSVTSDALVGVLYRSGSAEIIAVVGSPETSEDVRWVGVAEPVRREVGTCRVRNIETGRPGVISRYAEDLRTRIYDVSTGEWVAERTFPGSPGACAGVHLGPSSSGHLPVRRARAWLQSQHGRL